MTPRQKLLRWLYRTMTAVGTPMGVPPGSAEFRAGMVLLASVRLATTDVTRLAEATAFSTEFVGRIARRCRKARLWYGGTIRAQWMNKEHGDFAFLLDSMVAIGVIDRPPADTVIAKNKRRTVDRTAAGVCTGCGRPRDSMGKVCKSCKNTVKASLQRRRERAGKLTVLKDVDPLYSSREGDCES